MDKLVYTCPPPLFPSSPYGFRSLFRYAFVFIYLSDDFIEEIKLFLLYGASRDLIILLLLR